LTAIRAGQKQRKIDISIPKLDDFIHKVYINVARKIYKNVYLFEINIPPLQVQKHFRELEIIVQECILNTVRESIPVESILQAYMGETIEEDVVEEIKEQVIEKPVEPNEETQIIKENKDDSAVEEKKDQQSAGSSSSPTNENEEPKTLEVITETENSSRLSFNDIDYTRDENNNEIKVEAPKDIHRLEEISQYRNEQRRLESEQGDDDENPRLNIIDEDVKLDYLDIHNIDTPNEVNLMPDLLIDDIEVLA
jgi:hypothetical protein